MRVPHANVRTSADVDIDSAMTPMIDVVFLLLVFFVWTASFQIAEQVMPAQLSSQLGTDPTPLVQPSTEDDLEDIIIKVRFDGDAAWSINGRELRDAQAVEQRLASIARVDAAATVIIHPEKNVPLDYVIETYDRAKLTGFTSVSFAVNGNQ